MSRILSVDEAWALLRTGSDHVPPPEVRAAAAQALTQAEACGAGTLAARARAKGLSRGEPQPLEVLRRLVDVHAELVKAGDAGALARELAGGVIGLRWAEDVLSKSAARDRAEAPGDEEAPEPPLAHRALRRQLGLLLAAHEPEGAPLEAFRAHVQAHGHRAVHRALLDLGAAHTDGRVHAGHRAPARVPAKDQRPTGGSLTKGPNEARWRPFQFRSAP